MLQQIFEAIRKAGGCSYYVGGYVRDTLLKLPPKDIDVEIHYLSAQHVEEILSRFGELEFIGKSFGVYRIKGLDVDFSLPRQERKIGLSHKDFAVSVNPLMGITEALRRRDFTINAIAMNTLTEGIIDPFGGRNHLIEGILEVVDPDTFVEDPLRVLRGAQFCARFGLQPSQETIRLCRRLRGEYNTLPKERVLEELRKLLIKGLFPSLGVRFLEATGWLAHWPELNNLWNVPQNEQYHPEGTVDKHLCEVLDRAVGLRSFIPAEDQFIFMLAALLHDVGKYTHTFYKTLDRKLTHWQEPQPKNSKIVSYGHDKAGVELARTFLERITDQRDILERVPNLVGTHMQSLLMRDAKDKAFRKLAKRGCEMWLTGMLSWADRGKKPFYWFRRIESLKLNGPKETIVQGKHLIERGLQPGPEFGKIIQACEEIFISRGIENPEKLLDLYFQGRK